MPSEPSFENALKELEKTITELEQGDLPLEAQLKSFERGVALSRDCMKRLEEVEKRVELLVEKSDGSLATTAFDPEAS
jgi:exodeoxyribonuclease VII small subunit